MGHRYRGAIAAQAVALLLCACSAADFKQPIAAFADQTNAAKTTFQGYATSLDQVNHEQNLADIAREPKLLFVPASDCKRASKRCQLFIDDGRRRRLNASIVPNITAIMNGLSTYATNLNAIATADSAGEIKTAVDAANTNLIGLAKAADGLNKQLGRTTTLETQVTALATPLADIVTLALTTYVEQVKLQALRDATERMESIFPQVTSVLVEVGETDNSIKTTSLFLKFNDAQVAFKSAAPEERLAKLTAMEAAADAYDRGLNADPGAPFIKLAMAHTALTNALRSPDPSFEQVFAFIQQVADAVTRLANDAKAIDKALNPPQPKP